MSLIAKFLPKTELPSFFRVESYSANGQTRLEVRWNITGDSESATHVFQKSTLNLKEVVEAFPGTEKITNHMGWKMGSSVAENVPLPPNWTIECGAAPGDKEGFLFTFDVLGKHWEKHLEVDHVRLDLLADLIGWIGEANKHDRFRTK